MNNTIDRSAHDQNKGNPTSVTSAAHETMCINEGITSFFDADPGFTTTVNSEPDATFNVGGTSQTDLKDWLSRPVEIFSWNDVTGSNTKRQFNPWALFFNNSSVKNKIENYALLRCKLHVKIVVNASPTFWGLGVLGYKPLTNLLAGSMLDSDYFHLSQNPHIYTNPTNSQGGCLCLPFFYYNNWLNIGSLEEFNNMGTCYFSYLSYLTSSNTFDSNGIEYKVYAWASDVQLAQSTTGLALQAANEYATGPVSLMASSVANVAGRLKGVSWLAPYAKATEITATAVGKVAHIFGFSRPTVIDNPRNVKNSPFGHLANCGTHELNDRLCVDPKNELCVDSRTVGLDGSDEMTVSSIVTRECLISFNDILPTNVSGDLLFSMPVSPQVYWIDNVPSPLAFGALPFRYWRGDIIVRIVVSASSFHRGRILIQWDPSTDLAAAAPVNTVPSEILDLSVTRDIEFRIPYAARSPWLKVKESFLKNHSIILPSTHDPDYENGTLLVSLLNPVRTINNSTEPVRIAFFIRGADNLEFACPIDLPDKLSTVTNGFSLQSDDKFVLQSDEQPDFAAEADFSPLGSNTQDIISSNSVNEDAMPMVCMGEAITSFRTLLKRYNFNRTQLFEIGSGTSDNGLCGIYTSTIARWPLPYGQVDDGIDEFTTGVGNIAKLTLFNYLQGAFVGMRGSSRWKINHFSDTAIGEISVARSFTSRTVNGYSERYNAGYQATLSISELKDLMLPTYANIGYTLTNPETQTGIEVDIPQYSRYRFIPASPYSLTLGSLLDTPTDSVSVTAFSALNQNFDRFRTTYHHAVGDDFSFFFFLQAPRFYTDTLFPAPLP
jgi:hypothetical protein